ncbi:hypothetical protein GND98_017345 [Clostridium butyricum]|uniref:Uncharacterized protein n=1 Tax=Clostridium butyricum TaxID=1492 RepID=A0A6L9ESF1_CLOBU|nr:hypothetical protein [Clostridium butyricum]
MAFRYDTRHLPKQTQQIINKRDQNNKILKEESIITQTTNVYPISIFMKLGNDSTLNVNGNITMGIYKDFCDKNKEVWFSTDSLSKGMSSKRRKEFLEAINNNEIVEMYFVIGKGSNGNNDIQYKADVLDIETDANGLTSPNMKLTPQEYINENKKIWIKICNLKEFTKLTTKDFLVNSTNNSLDESLKKSQHHFGYIRRK